MNKQHSILEGLQNIREAMSEEEALQAVEKALKSPNTNAVKDKFKIMTERDKLTTKKAMKELVTWYKTSFTKSQDA